MSIEKITYIGPYIKISSKIYDQEYTRIVCPNKCKDTYYSDQNFCSKCGSELKLQSYMRKIDEVSELIIRDEFVDELVFVKENTLIANHRIGFNENRDLSNINIDQIDEEIKWFHYRYQNIISALRRISNFLEIFWGVVEYYN